jgi:hypothetical protein
MPYKRTIAAVRLALSDVFAQVDRWFDRPPELRAFKPASGGWSIDQVLEHITLTNHFLMLTLRKWADIVSRRAARGVPIPEGESDLSRLDVIGQRGSFSWIRPEHMEPTGQPTSGEVRATMQRQLAECQAILERLARGEGALCQIRMTVNDLGKIDLYQWLYFLAQHALRHLQQMDAIAQEAGSSVLNQSAQATESAGE